MNRNDTIQNNPKIIRAWCMYDWANSVYSLVITSAIFPIYYQNVAKGEGGSDIVPFFGWEVVNSVLYSYSLSFSFLLLAPLLPLLSGVADYSGNKRLFLKIFCYIGGLACIGLSFFDSTNLEWGICCIIMASIGYSGGLIFYDAFLPEIASKSILNRISARGYSYGYVGSVILMILCLGIISKWQYLHFPSEGASVRFSFSLVGIWWIGFAQIPFYFLPGKSKRKSANRHTFLNGFNELKSVWQGLKKDQALMSYIIAYFFFNMPVQTVMYLAATFGAKELKLADDKLLITVLLIQLIAAAGAFSFARLSSRIGNKKVLLIMISIWIVICVSAYVVYTEMEFYALAAAVGMVMGGIQSLSRATYSKLLPADSTNHASYFSFFDVTFILSIVMGTFTYGLVEHISGSMRNSTLALAVFFMIGFLLLTRVKSKAIQ